MVAMRLPLALASLLHVNLAVRAPSPADEVAFLQAKLSQTERLAPAASSPEDRLKAAMDLALARGRSPDDDMTNHVQPMINFGDAQYISYVKMGKQMLAGIIDTGSFELVVFGSDCSACSVASHYSHHFSETYEMGTLSTQHNYGSGATLCNEGFEQVSIGPFPAARQMFWEVVDAQMPVLQNAAFEAIIGVGPTEAALVRVWDQVDVQIKNLTAYYDQAKVAPRDRVLDAQSMVKIAIQLGSELPMLHTWNVPIFSICMGSEHNADGMIIWNDTAPMEHEIKFRQVSVKGESHTWSAALTAPSLVQVDGSVVQLSGCEQGCEALIDSGTSLLAAPTSIINNISESFSRLNQNCSNLEVLPDLHFTLGTVNFSLPPSAYVGLLAGEAPASVKEQLSAHNRSNTTHDCELLIMDTGEVMEEGNLWILGVPWFRKYYTSFQLGTSMENRLLFISEHTEEGCEPTEIVEDEDVAMRKRRKRRSEGLRTIQADLLHLPPPRRGSGKWWHRA